MLQDEILGRPGRHVCFFDLFFMLRYPSWYPSYCFILADLDHPTGPTLRLRTQYKVIAVRLDGSGNKGATALPIPFLMCLSGKQKKRLLTTAVSIQQLTFFGRRRASSPRYGTIEGDRRRSCWIWCVWRSAAAAMVESGGRRKTREFLS